MLCIYVTCTDLKQAKVIGKVILEKKLCACVNIIPKMHSLYIWNNQLEESEEIILLIITFYPFFHSEQMVKKAKNALLEKTGLDISAEKLKIN